MPMTPDYPEWNLLDQLCVETAKLVETHGLDRVVQALLERLGFEGRTLALKTLSEADPRWFGAKEGARPLAPSTAPEPPATVFVGAYEHKHGTDVSAYRTREAAYRAKAAIAREYWGDRADETAPDDHEGLSDDEVISAYFDGNEAEFFGIEQCDVNT